MGMESKYIWMNGQLVDYEKATLHFLTPALHYGAAVFEGIRSYNTKRGPSIFRLKEHTSRLIESAEIFGFRNLSVTSEEIFEGCKQVVKSNGFGDCYVRPLLYLVDGGWNLNVDGGKAAVGIAAWEWNNYLGEESLQKGIRANISSYTRHHVNVSMTKSKISGNYANSFLAKTESVRLGFEEAILLDPQGYVAECTGENIFLIKNGQIFTPNTAPVLEGITRQSIQEIAFDLGFEIREQPVSRDQLYKADEVFVVGTAAECIALSEIDFRKIGDGKMGPITKSIQDIFHKAVRGEDDRYMQWCTFVN